MYAPGSSRAQDANHAHVSLVSYRPASRLRDEALFRGQTAHQPCARYHRPLLGPRSRPRASGTTNLVYRFSEARRDCVEDVDAEACCRRAPAAAAAAILSRRLVDNPRGTTTSDTLSPLYPPAEEPTQSASGLSNGDANFVSASQNAAETGDSCRRLDVSTCTGSPISGQNGR